MFRLLSIISMVFVVCIGCSGPAGVEHEDSTTLSAVESPSLPEPTQKAPEAEPAIAETPPATPGERKKVGKGDLSIPLDDRVEEVLPAKIRRNPEGDPTVLRMRGYGVSQADLEDIASFTFLKELQIGWNDLGDEDLHFFADLDSLRLLGIRHNPRITGATFDQLAGLPALEELYLGECGLRPEYFRVFSESTLLRLLGLRSYVIDQVWIDALCSIDTLEEVHLNDSDITEDQISSLEQCLPGLIGETHKPRVERAQ